MLAGKLLLLATLLVANKSDDTVTLIDVPSGDARATLPTGHAPHEVAVSPDGTLAAVSDYGDKEAPGSSLTLIDVPGLRVLRTIDLGRHTRPHGLAWIGNERLAVTTEGSAHLLLVDPARGTVLQAVPTGQQISHMVAVAPLGNRAFVANIGSGSVTAIDLESGKKLRDIPTGRGAEGLALSPDGEYLWVANREDDTLAVVSAETLEVEADLHCPGYPIRLAFTPDARRVLVSLAGSGEIAVFDAITRKELRRSRLELAPVAEAAQRLFGDRFGSSPVPVGLRVAPDGARAYAAATQADMVVVLDPESLEVEGLIRAGHEPDGMGWSALTPPAPAP